MSYTCVRYIGERFDHAGRQSIKKIQKLDSVTQNLHPPPAQGHEVCADEIDQKNISY
jgi:hypothetical protein